MTLGGTNTDVTMIVLAGGKSRRFGTDKACAEVPGSGETMLERVASIGFGFTDQVLVVGPVREGLTDLNMVWIDDLWPDEGPLGGVLSALPHVSTKIALITGVDQPYLTTTSLDLLVKNCRKSGRATLYRDGDRIETLPVTLPVESVRPLLMNQWKLGVRSLHHALISSGVDLIDVDDESRAAIRDIDSPADFLKFNSVTDG